MRRILISVILITLLRVQPAVAAVADLQTAMTTFRNHCEWVYGSGSSANLLTAAQIQSLQSTIYSNRAFSDDNLTVMEQEKDLITYYAASCKKIFRVAPTYNGFNHNDFSSVSMAEAQFIVTLQQNVLTYCFSEAEVSAYPSYFAGFAFDCAKHFPGDVAAPVDPNAIYSVQINASQPLASGYEVLFSTDPAKRPTGAYLAPGSLGTVTVPPALVNQGYVVRVGAHVHFKGGDDGGNTNSYTINPSSSYYKDKMERMDGVTREYLITSTDTLIANPLGGNIYIEVPSGAANGIVTVQFKNTVRAPFYSNLPWRQTTLSQWQTTERTYPGAFADFEDEKCMFTIPRNWIYAFNGPVTMMSNWDLAMDAISDLQGLPRIRNNKTILYGLVDTSLKTGAGSPGYPQSNDQFNPTVNKAGNNAGHHYLYGPKFADSLHLHELGHGISISKFAGEVESLVNFPYVAVHNRKFGVSLDEANGRAVGNEGCATVSRDQAALMWILDPDFRAGLGMDNDSMKYQHRGWGKYTDIAGLFGWKALDDFWYSEAVDAANGITYTTNPATYRNAASDNRILRMSRAAGVDLTPLIHFWGVLPYNLTTLKASMLSEGLLPSSAIYDRIERYRNIVPHDGTAFDAHALAVSSAPRDNDWYTAQKASYDPTVGTQAVTKVQAILDLHFPGGRPGSPPPANSVIYTENFSGGGNALNDKAPTTGGGAWIANPIVTANGVLTADAGSAVLRFDPIPNKTYTVSLDFNYSSGTTDGWFGLGFTSVSPWITSTASTGDRFSNMNSPGHAWMLAGKTSMLSVWEGPKATNAIPFTNLTLAAGPHTMKIVINTTGTGSSFTADFFMDGISLTGGPKVVDTITLNDINYVGFTQYGGGRLTGSTVDNFFVSTGDAPPPPPPAPSDNYTEAFDGTGSPLNGKSTTSGGGPWIANSIVTDNGNCTASSGSAVLPFDPVPNRIYTLSMDFNHISTGVSWTGLGFCSAPPAAAVGGSSNTDRFSNTPTGYAWMLYNDLHQIVTYEGPKASTTNNGGGGPYTNAVHTMSVVIDTSGDGSTFTAEYFIDGNSINGGPQLIDAVTVAGINYVGFSQTTLSTGSKVDNFSLTSSPAGTAGTYGTWATANGIPGEPGTGDFDKDGLANLVEYALGLDPTTSSAPVGTFESGILSFEKSAAAVSNGDVTYAIEESDDLGITDPWTIITPTIDDFTTISYAFPTGQTKVFARLKVVQAP